VGSHKAGLGPLGLSSLEKTKVFLYKIAVRFLLMKVEESFLTTQSATQGKSYPCRLDRRLLNPRASVETSVKR
jgi:hypothetical protein